MDINELHAAEFRRTVLPTGTGSTGDAAVSDLKVKIKDAFDKCIKSAQEEQDKYDGETDHGKNADAQARWTRSIQERLTKAKSATGTDG